LASKMVQNGKTPSYDKQNWALCPCRDSESIYLLPLFPKQLQSSVLLNLFRRNFPYLQCKSYYPCVHKEAILRVNIFIITTPIWRSENRQGSFQNFVVGHLISKGAETRRTTVQKHLKSVEHINMIYNNAHKHQLYI
jgi:hypothetical protein